MPLTPEQQKELQELRRLDELEKKFGNREAAAEPEQSKFQTAGDSLANSFTAGYLPQIEAAGVKGLAKLQDLIKGGNLADTVDYDKQKADTYARLNRGSNDNPGTALAGNLAGSVAQLAVPGLGVSKGLAGVGKAAALAGAANPGEGAELDPAARVKNAAVGGGIQGAGSALAKFLGKTGDVGMQVAVGRTKYTPGAGTELANQGIFGTRGQMQKQVASKLGEIGKELKGLAKQIPAGSIDSAPVASSIQERIGGSFQIPGATPSAADVEKIAALKGFAEDVANRGTESGEQVLARRVAAGKRTYGGRDNPLLNQIAQASKIEQQGYSQALKEAFKKQTGSSALADADRAYGALKRAEKGLSAELSLPRSVMSALSTPLSRLPVADALTSGVSQLAVKGSKVVEPASSLLSRSLSGRDKKR